MAKVPFVKATVPAPLVTYISYLAQAGRTFKYTAEGPVGLAGDKKVVLLSARGGDYSNEFMAAMEAANRKSRRLLPGFNNEKAAPRGLATDRSGFLTYIRYLLPLTNSCF
ncbi:Flavodoxin-like fold [Paenibacillus sp. CF384]|nr:Flavodoxin-like fold [Paenibacillus sp. CF384]